MLGWAREEYWYCPRVISCRRVRLLNDTFFVQIMNNVTTALEDNRSAIILTSIDFSKAFKVLDHGPSLEAFGKKCASNQVLKTTEWVHV